MPKEIYSTRTENNDWGRQESGDRSQETGVRRQESEDRHSLCYASPGKGRK